MKFVLAFDSFKGCLTAQEACQAAADGLRDVLPDADIVALPLSDGGEGLVACISRLFPVRRVEVKVHGPLMEERMAAYALSADAQTAYMEMAAASGLTLVPPTLRNPLVTTTYGVGDMIRDAVDRGCRHIVMGIGGSATCDGGQGMLQALEDILSFVRNEIDITVACDVNNPLYGPDGAARVFGPQKGATAQQVILLDDRLRSFAHRLERQGLASPTLASHPGAGAAGGLGYGLMACLGATLQPGIDILLRIAQFDTLLSGADYVLTGEGCSDRQTLMGKVPQGVLRWAKPHHVPVHLLSGSIRDHTLLRAAGFALVRSINESDSRPLDTLLLPDVARQNIIRTTRLLYIQSIHTIRNIQ